jgi:hypothetical protein
MALGTRQSNIFAAEDWKTLYTTFSDANFQSYDFESIRKVMVDYLRTYYPEDFNDFTESSEYIALLDLIAFVAQGIAFRTDLNARENFLETAERRDSVLKLVKQLSYNPARNRASSGLLKINSISTTESLFNAAGVSIGRTSINWNDPGNPDWQQQWNQVLNAAMDPSQKVGTPYASKMINDITTEQYNLAVPTNIVPLFAFSAPILEANAPFEAVSASILTTNSIYEQAPGVRGRFGIIYQQDGKGYASPNTGFFLYFKQGQLQSLDFNIPDKLPNRIVNIPTDGVNNSDVWMYEMSGGAITTQWTQVQSTKGSNTVYNSVARGIRTLYTVETRLNDQISLVFGDGTFSEMPQGNYRAYFRVSNGLTYRISPADMSGINIVIPYVSRQGRAETLTINASLQYTVSNSSRRDLLDEIKAKAPQNFYTQNRMVNGEDYNIFPYARYSDIVKVKSVNRYSAGISRNLDLIDPTGRYSSTDLFADDGAIYKDEFTNVKKFTFNTRNEAIAAIQHTVIPIIEDNSFKHFYYEKYPMIDLSGTSTSWQRVTDDTGTCTGYFLDSNGSKQPIAEFTSNLLRYLQRNGLIKFEAPVGYYFDVNNVLTQGTPQLDTDKTYIWASIRTQTGNGTNDIYFAGRQIGAITLNRNIPTGALITAAYVPLANNLSPTLINNMSTLITNNVDFGLRFDYTITPSQNLDPWRIISSANLNRTGKFDLGNTGNTVNTAADSSWLIKFETDGVTYTVTYRGMNYVWASAEKVRFLNTNVNKVYDSKTNTFVNDTIKVLNVNTKPTSTSKLDHNISFYIYGKIVESDGYVDNSKILITYNDANNDGIIDDPTIFDAVTVQNTKNVFFKKYFDFDNLIRYQLLSVGTVVTAFATKSAIDANRNNYATGTVFYASNDDQFYTITKINNIKSVIVTADYKGYPGRQNLYFQYTHNSDEGKRIDPATSNLIDMYILTRSYDEAYRNYVYDLTGTVSEPTPPTDYVLQNDLFPELMQYKMLTDSLLLNTGFYKPLFGAKAEVALQATIQVVKGINTTISDNELASKIVTAMNDYFSIDNWNFGDTFYFSELSAFLHARLGGDLGSVVLIPKDLNAIFGSLYEIRSQPNEIFISAATPADIQVVSSVLSGINTAGVGTTNVVRGVTF